MSVLITKKKSFLSHPLSRLTSLDIFVLGIKLAFPHSKFSYTGFLQNMPNLIQLLAVVKASVRFFSKFQRRIVENILCNLKQVQSARTLFKANNTKLRNPVLALDGTFKRSAKIKKGQSLCTFLKLTSNRYSTINFTQQTCSFNRIKHNIVRTPSNVLLLGEWK